MPDFDLFPNKISRILLTRMKFIGDVVLTTPIIRAVREAFPKAFIAYMGDKKAVSLLDHNPHLDEIIPFDFTRPTILEQPAVAWKLRRRKFDAVIDLFSNPRSALLSYLTGAPIRIGKDVRGRGRFFTHRVADDGQSKSAIAFHYQYVAPLGVKPTCWQTEIFLTEDEKRDARSYLKKEDVDISRPIIAVHPGATWPNKIWLKERFSEFINQITRLYDVEVVLSLGPGDDALGHFIARACSESVRILPVLPVRQLAAVLSQCAAFVSNDCGPMHIGPAVGTPTFGIFGPEPEEIWFPYDTGEGHLAFRSKIWCSPCRTIACFRQGEEYLECMKLIASQTLVEAVGRALGVQHRSAAAL